MLTGNVILIGRSHVGKTTVGRALAAELGVKHVTASSWVRARARPDAPREVLTGMSRELLREQPTVCTDTLQAMHRIDQGGMVLEGFRNPFDFARVYRPERDRLVFLTLAGAPEGDSFDDGVAVIEAMQGWAVAQGIPRCASIHLHLAGLDGPTVDTACPRDVEDGTRVTVGSVQQAVTWLWAWVYREIHSTVDVEAQAKSGLVNVDLPAFPVLVRDSLLFSDPTLTTWTKARAVGIASYPGHTPTFTVLTDDGAVFSYVPAHHLRTKPLAEGDEELTLAQLVYHNCPAAEVTVVSHEVLSSLPVQVFERKSQTWHAGKYVATLDWYTDNLLMHLVCLDQGQVALVPSHKVLFGKTKSVLPLYRKMRGSWILAQEDVAREAAAHEDDADPHAPGRPAGGGLRPYPGPAPGVPGWCMPRGNPHQQVFMGTFSLAPSVTHVIGSDEAGYGTLAGDLIVVGVLVQAGWTGGPIHLADSKTLSPKKIQIVARELAAVVPYAIISYDPETIDRRGVGVCLKEGHRVVHGRLRAHLHTQPPTEDREIGHIADGNLALQDSGIVSVPKADSTLHAVMAASILAKGEQLRRMDDHAKTYSGYDFEQHHGYPTPLHLKRLDSLGPCPVHRMSYAPVKAAAVAFDSRKAGA